MAARLMDGETLRITITGVCGAVSAVAVAWIAARPNIMTAQIAMRQLELKEKELDNSEDIAEELAEVRAELFALREKMENQRKRGRK